MNTRSTTDLLPNIAVAHEGPLTVGAAAATLLSLIAGNVFHAQTDMVLVSVETDQLRITVNNTVPTATKGFLMEPGQMFWLTKSEAEVAQLIRVTTDAKIQVSQHKFR